MAPKSVNKSHDTLSNWGLIGHSWAVQLLRQHVTQHTLRHAYLFTGPLGVGRCTLAIRLAQALNCPQPLSPGEPCQSCQTCKQIEAMRHPDLFIVQADQVGGVIKVDQIRELQHSLALAPYASPYRVAILLRLEEANDNTANALLKTLEEPADQAILLVTAESAERLLATITSRCEIIRLRPTPPEQLSRDLQRLKNMPAEKADLVAHLSGGRPGYAIQLLAEPQLLTNREVWLNDCTRLLKASRVERFTYAESMAKDKLAMREAITVWLSLWRDIMLHASGSTVPAANPDRQAEIEILAASLDRDTIFHLVHNLENTFDLLERNVNPRLICEVLMLELPRVSISLELQT
jgi:DNA polymerase-3 subunit delta'